MVQNTASSGYGCPESQDRYPDGLLGVTAAFAILIGLIGTFGNLLAAMALLWNAKLRNRPSTAFMINLLVCLIPVCAVGMPMYGAGCIQNILYGCVLLPESVNVAAFAVGLTLSQVHINTICALAFNRLIAVACTTTYKKMMKPKWVTVYLVCIWIYSALLWIPLASGAFGGLKYEPSALMVSMSKESGSRVFRAVHLFFTYIFPVLFTSICYLVMYCKVRRIRREVRGRRDSVVAMNDSNAIRQWDDQVTRTILIIYIVLFACSAPHLVIHAIDIYVKFPVAWLLLHVLFWFQFCVDPIIYVTCSRAYRRALKECLNRIFPHSGLFRIDDTIPRSEGRSDMKSQRTLNSPATNVYLRPPPQKVEFSSEVHRDLLDPKIILDKS